MKHARFYQAQWHAAHEGRCQSWHRRKRDADRAIKQGDDTGPAVVYKHEIPLNTDAFIQFLNMHADTDNG